VIAGDAVGRYRGFLRAARRYRPHLLSEPEEKILAEKALTGASAWTRLFEELTSAISVELPSPAAGEPSAAGGSVDGRDGEREKVALDVALSRLMLPDRELRRATAAPRTASAASARRWRWTSRSAA